MIIIITTLPISEILCEGDGCREITQIIMLTAGLSFATFKMPSEGDH